MKFLTVFLLSLSLTAAFSACGSSASSSASPAKASAAAKGGQLTVRMLDIGQGDAFLLEKDGKFVMIDTGDIEHRDQIVALLHKYKVKEISKIIIKVSFGRGAIKHEVEKKKVKRVYKS